MIVTLIGFMLVIVVLSLLVGIINLFGKAMAQKVRIPRAILEPIGLGKEEHKEFDEVHLTAGESAAIAMALHLYYSEIHDEESNVITIKTVGRRYSPWSSKIYGINNLIR